MTKKSQEEISARKFKILDEIYRNKGRVNIIALGDIITKTFGKVGKQTVLKDLADLQSEGFPIEIYEDAVCVPTVGIEGFWKDTQMGERLRKWERKRKLAKVVFSLVKKNKNLIRKMVAGTGTTVRECVHELIHGQKDLENMRIYTPNLLVLHDFIRHKPDKLFVELPNGELDLERAALAGDKVADYLQELDIDAVITSFSDMSFEKGFCTEFLDKAGKIANLNPTSPKCKWIIIPIEWSKIGTDVGSPVAQSRNDQLNFIGGKRKYFIITNKPSDTDWDAEVDDPKLEDLQKWQNAYPGDVEIIYA